MWYNIHYVFPIFSPEKRTLVTVLTFYVIYKLEILENEDILESEDTLGLC